MRSFALRWNRDSGAVEVVAEFEQEFAAYVGASFGGGRHRDNALVVALRALEIGPGDEVITQANTFNASVAAIRLVGATPVLVDADECGFLIDDRQVESAISAKTRAILPVHLYGRATRMEEILRLADRHSLDVVEDAAQAHGAAVGGRRVGSIGRLGCFSFHPSKNLAAPDDGGMVVTSDQQLAAKIDRLRSLGQQGQNNHLVVGLNTHLHALQAIVLRAKLSKVRRVEYTIAGRSLVHTERVSMGLPDCRSRIPERTTISTSTISFRCALAYATGYCAISSRPESMRLCGIRFRSTSSRPLQIRAGARANSQSRSAWPINSSAFRSARTCNKRRSTTSSTRRSSSFPRRDHARRDVRTLTIRPGRPAAHAVEESRAGRASSHMQMGGARPRVAAGRTAIQAARPTRSRRPRILSRHSSQPTRESRFCHA